MSRKLYVNVFQTEIGPYGHVISPQQYECLSGMMGHGMRVYRDVEVRVTYCHDVSAEEAVTCCQSMADIWIDEGKPNISQIRAQVKGLAQQKLMH